MEQIGYSRKARLYQYGGKQGYTNMEENKVIPIWRKTRLYQYGRKQVYTNMEENKVIIFFYKITISMNIN